MSSLITYKTIKVLSPDPTGAGGLALNSNFKALADADTTLQSNIDTNTAALVTTNSNVAANTTSITANTASIATNTSSITANTSAIAANTTAIALKAPIASPTFTGTVTAPTFVGALTGNATSITGSVTQSQVTGLVTALSLKAPLASPSFSGTVTAITISGNGGLTLNGNSSNGIILCGDVCPLKFNGASVSMKDGSGAGGGAFNLDGGTITNGSAITATTFTGALVGNVTGNVTGNVSGTAGGLSANIAESQVTNLVTDLAAKATTAALATTNANVTANTTAIALKAPLASPTFTGTVIAPVINGNSSTGLIINGNSSSGITISGDHSAISVQGLVTNNRGLILSPSLTASSATDYSLQITPTYNQTSTAGSTDLLINRTQTALGSGSHYFINAQVAGTTKFSVDNTGKSVFKGDMVVYGSTTNVSNQYPLTIQDSSSNNLFLFNSYGTGNNRLLMGGSYSVLQQVGANTYLAPDNTGNLNIGSPIIASQTMTVAGNAGFGTTTPRWAVSLGSTLSNTKLALYDNNTGSAFYGFGVQSGYVVATANDVQTAYFCAANGGSLGIHNASPATYLDVAGAVAPAAVGVEDMLYLTKPTQGGVSYLEMAGFALGRWATTGAFEPKSRLDIKLKDVANSTAAPEVTVMTLQSNGSVGIGSTLPTAALDLKASTTTVASLRIRSGTAPTTPNDGDIWYDGTNLKIRVGGTTKTVTIT